MITHTHTHTQIHTQIHRLQTERKHNNEGGFFTLISSRNNLRGKFIFSSSQKTGIGMYLAPPIITITVLYNEVTIAIDDNGESLQICPQVI